MFTAYTDGSYKKDSKGEYGVGWGFVLLKGGVIIHEECGRCDEYVSMRNVVGECRAVIELLGYCEELGVKELNICHDYEGVAKWITGEWKAKNEMTQRYRKFVLESPIEIDFTWVRGHSDNPWNDYADKLAKKGVDF